MSLRPVRVRRSPLLPLLTASTALLASGAALPTEAIAPMTSIADITIQVPIIIQDSPIIVVPRREATREVTVQFIAEGDNWATIYLDGRRLFNATNTRRNRSVTLAPGAYRLEITGVTRFDVWGSGYLDVGRDDANLIVIRYGKENGIAVAGDPNIWFPE